MLNHDLLAVEECAHYKLTMTLWLSQYNNLMINIFDKVEEILRMNGRNEKFYHSLNSNSWIKNLKKIFKIICTTDNASYCNNKLIA